MKYRIIWEGEHIGVREYFRNSIKCMSFGFYRPDNPNQVFAFFENEDHAVFIAKFINDHGGNYEPAMRKAARTAWDNINE